MGGGRGGGTLAAVCADGRFGDFIRGGGGKHGRGRVRKPESLKVSPVTSFTASCANVTASRPPPAPSALCVTAAQLFLL